MELNENQKEIVTLTEGPLLIIAGPGSGKTFTLVERIIFLLEKKEIEPSKIFVSTFTEKAAKELITRISNRLLELKLNIDISTMKIGTLHSLFLKILEENIQYSDLKKNYRLIDEFEQKYIIYKNMDKFLEIKEIQEFLKEILGKWNQTNKILEYLNKLNEQRISKNELFSNEKKEIKTLGKILEIYEKMLEEENILDFSNIQLKTFNLLTNEEILKKINNEIDYLMIDEYQDTNSIQEEIIFKLAGKKQNLCVVGDDDQGLYRFRGATIRNILEFPKKFEKCKIIKLDINYRSDKSIIDFYDSWIKQLNWNGFRYEKKLKAFNENISKKQRVLKVSGENTEENWYNEIFQFINYLKEEKILTDYNQIAFLFKSVKNPKVIGLCKFLENHGIPIYSPRAGIFFDREEIKLMLGGILGVFPQITQKVLEDSENNLNKYYRECLVKFKEIIKKNYNLNIWFKEKYKKHLKEDLDYSFSIIFYEILQFEPFSSWLKDDNKTKNFREIKNLSILSKLITNFEFLENIQVLNQKFLNYIATNFFLIYMKFLKEGGVNEYEDEKNFAPSGYVSFLTIHQSKGLEFPIVIVGSLDSKPRKQYNEIDEILENEIYRKGVYEPFSMIKDFDFWRLFYTAFSRAQDLLILTTCEKMGKKKLISPSSHFIESYKNIPYWKMKKEELKDLKLKKVKETSLKDTYSFTSDILVYNNCPQEYKFFKEYNFAPVRKQGMIFGTLIHQTIEDINKKIIEDKDYYFNREVVYEWFRKNYDGISKNTKSYLAPVVLNKAFEQILSYIKRKSFSDIAEVEKEITFVKENYILKGVIDLINKKDDGYEIIDFKSTKKPNISKDKESLDIYKKQLEIYKYLLEKQGKKVKGTSLYYTIEENGSPFINFKLESTSIEKTVKTFDDIVKKIQAKNFNGISKDKKKCKNCDMRFYCQIDKEKR